MSAVSELLPFGTYEVHIAEIDGDDDVEVVTAAEYERLLQAYERLSAALEQPEGWVSVPRKPTMQMLMAAKKAQHDHASFEDWWEYDGGDVMDLWRAMLAATPPATKGQGK